MAADSTTGKFLLITKIVQAFLIFSVLVYAVMLYVVLPRLGFGVLHDTPLLITIAQVFGVISAGVLAMGFLMPWLASKMPQLEIGLLFAAYITRAALFSAVGVYGFILCMLGAGWQITLPFIAASGLSLVITFPTGGRWQKFRGDKVGGE